MRLATGIGALMAMTVLLGGLPATLHAQNGGWAVPKGEEAFSQNRFPELKGLTYSQEDQRKAVSLCAQYGGGGENQLCRLAVPYYLKEGQQEADAKKQSELSSAQASAQTVQSPTDDGTTVSPTAPQKSVPAPSQASSDAGAISVATASSSTEIQTSEQAAVGYQVKRQAQDTQIQAQMPTVDQRRAQKQAASEQKVSQLNQERAKAQEDAKAKNQQAEDRDEKTALYWKVGILGFLASNVILFVGAAKKKFVVFYDKWDIIHTTLIFVAPACGYFLAWLIDVGTSGQGFLHPICVGLGWLLAAWFSALTLISSIRHNRNVVVGMFVGLMKIYTVVLIASIAWLSFILLTSSMGLMPRDMDSLEKMQRVKQDKESGAMWAVVAAGLLYLLVNGAEVYEERGWNVPS